MTSDIREELVMRYYAANDLEHPGLTDLLAQQKQEAAGSSDDPVKPLFDSLNKSLNDDKAKDGKAEGKNIGISKRIRYQLLSRWKYPSDWSQKDLCSFDTYWKDYIENFSVTPDSTEAPDAKQEAQITSSADQHKNTSDDDQPKSSSPTVLSVSQKIYDAEVTRRESINTRCSQVLNTAGVLGTLVVAAGALGLIQQGGSHKPLAWIVYVFFVISLLYLICSIVIALWVHGDIQGDTIDPHDLVVGKPTLVLDQYNCNVAKTNLLYGTFNWCLNNKFKYRLHSAQRYLRNGLIAIIVAGALSPWLLTTGATGTTSGLPQTSPLVGTHATASNLPVNPMQLAI
jgi:hypothetical protein